MRVFFDTSVLVAASLETHEAHNTARAWLDRAHAGDFEWLIGGHTLAECYGVLSTHPYARGVSTVELLSVIERNARSSTIITLSAEEYFDAIRFAAQAGFRGGMIYDLLAVRAAQKGNADRLLTLNPSHFRRAWPEGAANIVVPS